MPGSTAGCSREGLLVDPADLDQPGAPAPQQVLEARVHRDLRGRAVVAGALHGDLDDAVAHRVHHERAPVAVDEGSQ